MPTFRQTAQARAYLAAAQSHLGMPDEEFAEWLVGISVEIAPALFDVEDEEPAEGVTVQ